MIEDERSQARATADEAIAEQEAIASSRHVCVVVDVSILSDYRVGRVIGPYASRSDAEDAAAEIESLLNDAPSAEGVEPIEVLVRRLEAPA